MDKIWLNRYPSDMPTEIPDSGYASLIDLFDSSVEKYDQQSAFLNMGQRLSFRQLEQQSRAMAAYLQNELGVKQGDRVAVMMPNLLQYPIALFGILRMGGVVVNVNPLYTPRELEHQLKDAGVNTIIIAANFAATLEKVIANTAVKNVIVTSLGDELSPVKSVIVNFVVKYVKRMVPAYQFTNAISWNTALKQGRELSYTRPSISQSDIAFLQYTGGTTGVAKGAVLSHGNIIANVMQAKVYYSPILREGKELVVTALPLYHIFALTVNCFLFIEMGGESLLITNPRDIPAFIKDLNRYPFTAITGVNTLFNALLNHPEFKELDFSNLRLAVGGGMAVQSKVAERWLNTTGKMLLEGYGLTESSPMVAAYPYNLNAHNGSIGLPMPSTDIRIIDDEGNVLPLMKSIGELQVKGPQVMQGYWQRPEATKEVLSEDGWLSTGDIVEFDDEGFLHLVDRKKDVIIVSGFNVYPNEIEDVVMQNTKVLEVAAIGVPHEVSGEIVKVCIAKRDDSLTKEEVLAHCRKYLTGYKVPRIVEFHDALPKTNVGKILRRELRDNQSA